MSGYTLGSISFKFFNFIVSFILFYFISCCPVFLISCICIFLYSYIIHMFLLFSLFLILVIYCHFIFTLPILFYLYCSIFFGFFSLFIYVFALFCWLTGSFSYIFFCFKFSIFKKKCFQSFHCLRAEVCISIPVPKPHSDPSVLMINFSRKFPGYIRIWPGADILMQLKASLSSESQFFLRAFFFVLCFLSQCCNVLFFRKSTDNFIVMY